MTKKSFLTLISLVILLIACGNSNNSKDGCTIGKSFGTRSLTKKEITQTCIEEIVKADFAVCSWKRDKEETAKHISDLQTLTITFGKECKGKDVTVECPDFIPTSLKLTKLTGCEVYSIEPDTDCLVPCADIYFSTNDDVFHTVYVGGFGEESITSSDKIKEASFASSLKIGSNNAVFTWSEKSGEEKKVSVEMIVADSSTVDEEPVIDENNDEEIPDEDAE